MVEPIKYHVLAKRYLAREKKYFNSLSEASKISLKLQGGILNKDESKEFEKKDFFKNSIKLRKFDEIAKRTNGVMYAMTAGKTLAYALFNLQNRGKLFLGHGQEVYVGQIVGLHSRDNDLPVNPTKAKQLTNIRLIDINYARTFRSKN